MLRLFQKRVDFQINSQSVQTVQAVHNIARAHSKQHTPPVHSSTQQYTAVHSRSVTTVISLLSHLHPDPINHSPHRVITLHGGRFNRFSTGGAGGGRQTDTNQASCEKRTGREGGRGHSVHRVEVLGVGGVRSQISDLSVKNFILKKYFSV